MSAKEPSNDDDDKKPSAGEAPGAAPPNEGNPPFFPYGGMPPPGFPPGAKMPPFAAAQASPKTPPKASPWKQGRPPMFYEWPDGVSPMAPPAFRAYPPPFVPPPPHMTPDGRPIYWANPSQAIAPRNDVDGRAGATSPSQIENTHRDEVQHMGCTCKKTRCLKLYCQCFAVKIYCGNNCRCLNCSNNVRGERVRKEAMRNILARNPGAFETKFQKGNEEQQQQKPLAHKLGCKCRKSACMKKVCVGLVLHCACFYSRRDAMWFDCRIGWAGCIGCRLVLSSHSHITTLQYCECYAGNVHCSNTCRCVGCKNTRGTMDEFRPPMIFPDGPAFPMTHPSPVQVMQRATQAAAATKQQQQQQSADSEPPEEGINSLMMAAYAMTEFGQGSAPLKRPASETKTESNKKTKGDKDDDDDDNDDEEPKAVKV